MRTVARGTSTHRPKPPKTSTGAHHTNRPLAEALFAAANGDRITIATAPPGAGKTFLISHLAHQLSTRMGLRVAIAAQTRAQSYDVANRIAAIGATTRLIRGTYEDRPRELSPTVTSTPPTGSGKAGVTVATSARWRYIHTAEYRADILLVDEAYQMTYADLIALGDLADQIVLVGDPGQISPIVTGETRRWADSPTGPHHPAPLAVAAAHAGSTTEVKLDTTYRLGPKTTALIAPLYPALPFTSARPPAHVTDNSGPLPEYVTTTCSGLRGPSDPTLARIAERTARTLLDSSITTDHTRVTTPHDIAVIAPHVDQAALISAHLADLPDIFIGTINQAQGLERHIVVAIHPLTGHPEAPPFATDLGRLCVALSRHRSHLSLITDTSTTTNIQRAMPHDDSPRQQVLETHAAILSRLTHH